MSAVELRRAGRLRLPRGAPGRRRRSRGRSRALPARVPGDVVHVAPRAAARPPTPAIARWRSTGPARGRSEPDPPATWERQVEAVERFVAELDLPPVVLVVHDWGGLIGLRWACDHPERVSGARDLLDSGFFSDGKWHGMAEGLRTPGTGRADARGAWTATGSAR